MRNKKNIFALIISCFFIALVSLYFFNPIKGLDLKGSLKDLSSKATASAEMNEKKKKYATELQTLRLDAKEKEIELQEVLVASNRSQELFNELLEKQQDEGDWSMHIPSLLIELETSAKDRKVDIAIDYKTLDSEGKSVSTSGQGLKVTKAKVDVSGNYHNVKEYIKFVEDIDFISVEELALSKLDDGGLVGTYYINIYHLD